MRNPIQEYNIARSMPIQALANVLRGVSDMVSLGVAHAALKEKMEAEVAKKGASAMQMAGAPKVKDKDLAMAQGLGASPADVDVPMGGIVGGEGTFGTGAAGGGSVVAFQAGGLGALNMAGDELKSFIDAMVKKGVPPTQVTQFAQQAQNVATNNPGALKSFLKAAASRFGVGVSGGAGAMMGFTDALIASEKGGRPVTGATPGYNYPAEEMISGVEPGVVGPSTNKGSLDQLFSNIGAIMPSGIGAETRQASDFAKAQERIAQAASGQGPDVHSPKLGATETRRQELLKQAKPEGAPAPGGGPAAPTGGIADLAAAQARVDQPIVEPPLSFDDADKLAEQLMGKYKIDPGKRKEFTDFSKEYVDTLKNAGYDFDLVKNQVRELAKEKEALKGEKKEAQNLRLLEAGLGILGGESPYAFVNIGKGATPALQGLAKDLKEIKKTSRQLDKETMQLNLLQNQMAEGKVKYSQDRLDKQEDRFQRIVEKDMDNRLSLAKTLSSNAVTKYATDKSADTSLKTAEMQQQTSRLNLQATQAERDTAREATLTENVEKRDAAYKKAAIEQAAEDVKMLPAEQQAAEIRKRAKQYYDMFKAKDFGGGDNPVAAAQAELARRGIK
jgi:hypothetical protein